MESQIDYQEARIMFLKKFMEEIIFNMSIVHTSKKNIHVEKLKKKLLNPETSQPKEFNIINHKILSPIKYQKDEIPLKKDVQDNNVIKKEKVLQKPKIQKNNLVKSAFPIINDPVEQEVIESIKPEYHQRPKELNLGKLEPIFNDPMVQTIECTGPGKNILVNKFGKINVTKTVLTAEDINEIISNFSNLSQIPLVDGILKAAVGNLMISAVSSTIVGTRFIINRINPQINEQKS